MHTPSLLRQSSNQRSHAGHQTESSSTLMESVLPPSAKRRRRRTGCGSLLSDPYDGDQRCNMLQPLVPDTGQQRAAPSYGRAVATEQRGARRRKRSGASSVAKGAMVVFLVGGVGTAVTAFSAVCSAPPRQRPHRQLTSTNNKQPPQPIMVPSPPLVGSTPETRQFLEDIISGQAAVAAAAAAVTEKAAEKRQQGGEEQEEAGAAGGRSTAVLGLTDWGGAGGAFRLKQEPGTRAVVAAPARRPAPLPREVEKEEEEDTGPPAVVRRGRTAAVPAKKPEPKYGYRRSSNKRTRAIHDMCAELCQTKLLTRADEYELGTKIQTLMRNTETRQQLAAELGRAPTRREWARACRLTVSELEESLRVGEESKISMVEANMRMVISIARKYRHYGVPLTDLIQEGSLGLIRAVEKFDPERGFKLSTYSAWWIQQSIFKGIAHQSRTIRLPMHVHNLLGRVRRAQRELANSRGYQPSDHQIAGHLDIPVTRLKRYLELTKESVSFELPTGVGSFQVTKERVLGDTLVAKERGHPEREGDMVLFKARLREVVGALSDDEKIVLSLRFGLDDGGKRKSLRQIAEMVHTSQPYVRRLEGAAMRKLRSPEQQTRLRDFISASRRCSRSSSASASYSAAFLAELQAATAASSSSRPRETATAKANAPARSSSSVESKSASRASSIRR